MSVFRFHAPMRAPGQRSPGAPATADLRRQVDRMQLIGEATWTIAKDRVGADDEQLFRRIKQIDLRDGKLDGRSKKPTQRRSERKRVVSARTGVCVDCGAMASRKTLI